jgi:flagellar FliL protein
VADETKNVSVSKMNLIPNNPNKFTMYIILGLIALLIMVMVMATVLILTFSNIKKPSFGPNNYNPNQGIVESNDEFGLLVPLNEIIVNLSAAGGDEHYLKVNITLEVLNNEKVKEEVVKRVPQLRDVVISILRTKTKDKIDEEAGKEKLGDEINNKINSIIGGAKVKHVYFEDFMIQ